MLISHDYSLLSVLEKADPEELRHLARITSGIPVDDATWRDYVAWLRARKDVRGDLLELALVLTTSPRPDDTDRAAFTALLAQVDPSWWRLVQPRPYQLNCGTARHLPPAVRFAFECPMQWQQLAGTDDPLVRHCDRCGENVYRADTKLAAEAHARLGHCISVPSELTSAHAHGGMTLGRPAHPVQLWASALFGEIPLGWASDDDTKVE